MAEAGKRPWRVEKHNEGNGHSILDATGKTIGSWHAYGDPERAAAELATSELIVKAVNSHDPLVKASSRVAAFIRKYRQEPSDADMQALEDALALAKA